MSCGCTRKSPVGQIPSSWRPLSGPIRLPSSSLLRKPARWCRQRSNATKAGIASTAVASAKAATRQSSSVLQRHATSARIARKNGASQTDPGRLSTHASVAQAAASGSTVRRPRVASVQGASAATSATSQRAGDLLDAAPEDVAEQQRRLCRDHRERRPQPARVDHALEQRVERQRQEHRHERQVRLVEPGDVVGQQLMPDAQRHQRAGRVAERERRRQRRLVGRGREPGEAAAVLHHAIGHREVRGGVVELDVAGEGRLPGEDDRRGEHGERRHRGGNRREARPPSPRQRRAAGRSPRGRRRAGPTARRSRRSASRTAARARRA